LLPGGRDRAWSGGDGEYRGRRTAELTRPARALALRCGLSHSRDRHGPILALAERWLQHSEAFAGEAGGGESLAWYPAQAAVRDRQSRAAPALRPGRLPTPGACLLQGIGRVLGYRQLRHGRHLSTHCLRCGLGDWLAA